MKVNSHNIPHQHLFFFSKVGQVKPSIYHIYVQDCICIIIIRALINRLTIINNKLIINDSYKRCLYYTVILNFELFSLPVGGIFFTKLVDELSSSKNNINQPMKIGLFST